MHRFEAFPSRAKLFGLFLLTVVMVAVAAFCTTLPQIKAQVAGWAGVLFFGLGLFVFPRAMLRSKTPKIVMDEAGIHSGSSLGIIEWSDITGFRIDSVKSTKFLSVFVRDVSKYLDRMPTLARKSAQ
jgi:hypothetical protein